MFNFFFDNLSLSNNIIKITIIGFIFYLISFIYLVVVLHLSLKCDIINRFRFINLILAPIVILMFQPLVLLKWCIAVIIFFLIFYKICLKLKLEELKIFFIKPVETAYFMFWHDRPSEILTIVGSSIGFIVGISQNVILLLLFFFFSIIYIFCILRFAKMIDKKNKKRFDEHLKRLKNTLIITSQNKNKIDFHSLIKMEIKKIKKKRFKKIINFTKKRDTLYKIFKRYFKPTKAINADHLEDIVSSVVKNERFTIINGKKISIDTSFDCYNYIPPDHVLLYYDSYREWMERCKYYFAQSGMLRVEMQTQNGDVFTFLKPDNESYKQFKLKSIVSYLAEEDIWTTSRTENPVESKQRDDLVEKLAISFDNGSIKVERGNLSPISLRLEANESVKPLLEDSRVNENKVKSALISYQVDSTMAQLELTRGGYINSIKRSNIPEHKKVLLIREVNTSSSVIRNQGSDFLAGNMDNQRLFGFKRAHIAIGLKSATIGKSVVAGSLLTLATAGLVAGFKIWVDESTQTKDYLELKFRKVVQKNSDN